MERGNGWEFRLVGRWVSGWVDGWVSVIPPHLPNQPNSHTSPISLMYMNVLTKQAYICTYLLTNPPINLNSHSTPYFINIFGSTNQANIPTYLEPNHNLPTHLTPSHPPHPTQPACLPVCLPPSLPTYPPPTHPPTHLPTYLPKDTLKACFETVYIKPYMFSSRCS